MLEMIGGSLLLPLFLTVLSLFVARSLNRRVIASEASSLGETGTTGSSKRNLGVEIKRFVAWSLVSLGPALAFIGAWQALIGWPGFDFFSGPEILLVATPVLAILSSSISHRIWRQVCFGLIGIGTIFLFLRPLNIQDLSLWLMIAAVIFFFCVWSYFFSRSVVDVSGESCLHRFETAGFYLSNLGIGLLLAFEMLMWGSASWAQVMGGVVSSLSVNMAFILIDDVKNWQARPDWLWLFYCWQGILAHFYLEVPIQFLIPLAALALLSVYWEYHFKARANFQRLILLAFIVFATVFASVIWAFLTKPKSFY
jgi:hypothetical protein